MKCEKCGKPILDNEHFCIECKKKILDEAATNARKERFKESYPTIKSAEDLDKVRKNSSHSALYKLVRDKKISIPVFIIVVLVLICVIWLLTDRVNEQHLLADNSNPDANKINFEISQVQAAQFPDVNVYIEIKDSNGQSVKLENYDFLRVVESDREHCYEASEVSVKPLDKTDEWDTNLVVDHTSAMGQNNRLDNEKTALKGFIAEMSKHLNCQFEITGYGKEIDNEQVFTTDQNLLNSAIDSLQPDGNTSFQDALYDAVQRIHSKSGFKYVIGFTCGGNDKSLYNENQIIDLCNTTSTPLYILGIGSNVDSARLVNLCRKTGGVYLPCPHEDIVKAVKEAQIYIEQQYKNPLKVSYKSTHDNNLNSTRKVHVLCKEGSKYSGNVSVEYIPDPKVEPYNNQIKASDYILPDSNSRYYTADELNKLSLWELWLARNELYARHGRGFNNKDLQEYFNSKPWYKRETEPKDYDDNGQRFMNDFERKNIDMIVSVERHKGSPYV